MKNVSRFVAPVLAAVVLIAAALAPAQSQAGYYGHRHYGGGGGGAVAAGVVAGLATAVIASSVQARPVYSNNYGYAAPTAAYASGYGTPGYQQAGYYDDEEVIVVRRRPPPPPMFVQPRPMYAYPMYARPHHRWCRDRMGRPVKCFVRRGVYDQRPVPYYGR